LQLANITSADSSLLGLGLGLADESPLMLTGGRNATPLEDSSYPRTPPSAGWAICLEEEMRLHGGGTSLNRYLAYHMLAGTGSRLRRGEERRKRRITARAW